MKVTEDFKCSVELKVLANIKINLKNCWEFTKGRNAGGYGVVRIHDKSMLTHRASYLYHYNSIPTGLHVLHKCDNPCCCNPEHLFIGTDRDNMEDKVRKGRQSRQGMLGKEHPMAILEDKNVITIFTSSLNTLELASIYNVSPSTISAIRNKSCWKHVTKDLKLPLTVISGAGKKLTVIDVAQIYTSKLSRDNLAILYSVDRTTIDKIKRKTTWKKVTDKIDGEI